MDYDRYFKKLIDKNIQKKQEFLNEKVLNHRKGKCYADGIDYQGFKYNLVISSPRSRAYGKGFVGLIVELYIYDNDYFESYFNQLKEHRINIEKDLNIDNIVWQSPEDAPRGKVARVYAKKAVDIEDTTKWDEYAEWQINTMIKFLNVLPKYTKNFKKIVSAQKQFETQNKDNMQGAKMNSVKNIILYGAPGVGKTHNYQNLISMIEEGRSQKEIFDTVSQNLHVDLQNETFESIKKDGRVEFVTFHQSYSYEDFIEGFRPSENNHIKLQDGIFKRVCSDAGESDKNFYIVIDEINRGNISKIFGELITLIEEDKRDGYEVTLPYSKDKFKVPSNLYIIATMNSTDKSIATIDIALRRRFTFLKMKPNNELVKKYKKAQDLMNALNEFISHKDKGNLGEDYMLGHSYFMKIENDEDLEFVKDYKIRPLLEEYFYADEKNYKKAVAILNKENQND